MTTINKILIALHNLKEDIESKEFKSASKSRTLVYYIVKDSGLSRSAVMSVIWNPYFNFISDNAESLKQVQETQDIDKELELFISMINYISEQLYKEARNV